VSPTPADMLVTIASHGAALLFFAAFIAVLVFGGNRQGAALYLIVACVATAAWSGSLVVSASLGQLRSLSDLILETLRNAAWIAFLYRLLDESAKAHGTGIPRWLRLIVGAFLASIIAADALHSALPRLPTADYTMIGRLVTPIIALTLIENLARNDWQSTRWWGRFLFVGLGGIFAYDLFLYSEALLFRRVNFELYAVRGAVDLIAVPLMAISFARNPTLAIAVHVSRQFVFHTMTFAGAGVYLLMMAVAGYYLRDFGGTWGTFLQVTFLSAALALVFLTLSSGRFRSAVRNFVSTHFFSYKYDYRHEWLQFIRLISAQESLLPLHDRVIQALANIVDSPAGAMWVERGDVFVNTASWNAPLSREAHARDNRLAEWFETTRRIIDLSAQGSADAAAADRPPLPEWLLSLPRAWVIVPLIHRHRALGFLALAAPRASRRLDPEDHDLLTTAGRQAASYIAEEEAARALLDARQLELFNQRFAFVVHDIKNLVSQLSLILANVERHGENPEFQRDVIATVGHSVARMKSMLEQLGAARRKHPQSAVFDLAELIRRDWTAGPATDGRLHIAVPHAACLVRGEPDAVSQVLRHLVQNGLEAVGNDGRVEIRLTCSGAFATIIVADNGPGMTAEFVRDKLFRPFSTTKASGYGIGAYQARELIRRMGGKLEVTSAPGEGTQISVQLPLAESRTASALQVQEA